MEIVELLTKIEEGSSSMLAVLATILNSGQGPPIPDNPADNQIYAK